jgi:DNA repair protein RadD
MIWKFWPLSKLQHEIGSQLLENIGEILPLVDDQGAGIFFETDRSSLVKLMTAFADEDYFAKSENIRTCLDFLPPAELAKLALEVGVKAQEGTVVGIDAVVKKVSKSIESRTKFLEFFDLPRQFYPKTKEKLLSVFTAYAPSSNSPITIDSPYKVLKDYQSDVFYRALDRLAPPMARLLLQMPTGSGKTRTAMEIIAGHITSSSDKKKRVVWLANSQELCEQAVSCFMDVWSHVGTKNVNVHRFWGGNIKPHEDQYSEDDQFIVGSLQSLWPLIRENDLDYSKVFSEATLLIIDEAHISVAETYSQVVRNIASISQCRLIGLTATPGRAIEEETGKLSDLFHGEIVSLRDLSNQWGNAIAYLRSKEILSSVNYAPLVLDSQLELTEGEVKKLKTELDFPQSVLKKVGLSQIRSAEIVKRVISVIEDETKVLLFAPSIENSKFLTSLFTFMGYRSAHIDGNTPSAVRRQIVNEYIDGKIQILCNYGVLAAGFDAPKIDVLCIARPTKSPVLYSQMIGRGLRGPAVGGTKNCTIIEVKDNFLGQGTQDQLYNHFGKYWEN